MKNTWFTVKGLLILENIHLDTYSNFSQLASLKTFLRCLNIEDSSSAFRVPWVPDSPKTISFLGESGTQGTFRVAIVSICRHEI